MTVAEEYPRPWKSDEEHDGRCVLDANGRWVFAIQYDEADRERGEVDALVDWIVDIVNQSQRAVKKDRPSLLRQPRKREERRAVFGRKLRTA